MSEEYFIDYMNDKVFVILLGSSAEKTYLYYPKGDALFVIGRDKVELMEIEEVIGRAPAGFKLSPPKESWEQIKSRKVTWYILDQQIEADNVYLVMSSESDYRKIENTASPDRLKYFVLKDANPHEYRDWCCVLIASTRDMDVPSTFKKVYMRELVKNNS
ncbi:MULTISPECIES: hypothetical protein [Metallosphaera]|uniref:Uncharacterized protein n=3 Tax=Metallosphaera TaxID=41980 RepID=A4YE46_METS5|nr:MULTISPECIES: hypothetical protein [Metallosphaera]ABP94698.1 hypothetical protein Msed_0523 [Metallosphaera sedula DSM 5348]AIM26685.1 hypothetical protein HA72_0523 [Metallosphaera sedula]AKV73648.1 hypothetical protein MsedA_0535 [Metallosphaera sedula]AKV75888.1 hypothetical protein MsedB_0535 [Metallosphaera sedula]AKV78139.1 hypothetical protein MsedC_0534 [Metallosphaera sedula]